MHIAKIKYWISIVHAEHWLCKFKFVNVKIKEDLFPAYVICCDNAESVWIALCFSGIQIGRIKKNHFILFEYDKDKYILKIWQSLKLIKFNVGIILIEL